MAKDNLTGKDFYCNIETNSMNELSLSAEGIPQNRGYHDH